MGCKNAKCPKFEQQAAITPKRYKIGCQLLLITNRKSHTGFRLVPTSTILNDPERRNSPYLAFFHQIRYIFRPIKPIQIIFGRNIADKFRTNWYVTILTFVCYASRVHIVKWHTFFSQLHNAKIRMPVYRFFLDDDNVNVI